MIVAHNAAFDLSFVRAECGRAGWPVPPAPSLCTLEESLYYLPDLERRRLHDCCWAFEIPLTDAHSALGDARATAARLAHYLDIARTQPQAPAMVTLPAVAAQVSWLDPIPAVAIVVSTRPIEEADVGAFSQAFANAVAHSATRWRRQPAPRPGRRCGGGQRPYAWA